MVASLVGCQWIGSVHQEPTQSLGYAIGEYGRTKSVMVYCAHDILSTQIQLGVDSALLPIKLVANEASSSTSYVSIIYQNMVQSKIQRIAALSASAAMLNIIYSGGDSCKRWALTGRGRVCWETAHNWDIPSTIAILKISAISIRHPKL